MKNVRCYEEDLWIPVRTKFTRMRPKIIHSRQQNANSALPWGRSLDTVTKFKYVAKDKTGKAMENARHLERIFGDSHQVQDCCSGFCMDRLDGYLFSPVALLLDIYVKGMSIVTNSVQRDTLEYECLNICDFFRSQLANLERREDPGAQLESLETTVQMVADQQSNSRWRTIGILDVDLCGPIIPRMMNVEGKDNYSCSFLLVGFQSEMLCCENRRPAKNGQEFQE
ncbi:hypothetical protein ACROYT_G017855 [Oculina patagonica]